MNKTRDILRTIVIILLLVSLALFYFGKNYTVNLVGVIGLAISFIGVLYFLFEKVMIRKNTNMDNNKMNDR